MRTTIAFDFDFLSPFAYLARHRLTQLAAQFDCAIDWHAIDLMQAKNAIGNTGPGNRDLPAKLAYFKTDLVRWVAEYNLPFKWVGNYASRRMNAGALYARERGVAAAYVRDAFHAAWGEGARLDDPEVLARLAEARGWDAAGFLRYVDSPAAAAALESATAQAVARGVFGVPTMTIGSDMWWGNDRLFMLERHLAKMAADCKAR